MLKPGGLLILMALSAIGCVVPPTNANAPAPPIEEPEPPVEQPPTPEPEGPSCTADGDKCSASSECCAGAFCIAGRCLTCPADYPQYCPQLGGGCWQPNTVCSTVTECSDGLWGCRYSFLSYDCNTGSCHCPTNYPVWCDASGSSSAACWSTGTDCASRVECSDGITHACPTGYRYDCATKTCKSGSVTPPPPPPPPTAIPAWVVGTYSRRGKQENNVYFRSDDRSITFRADGSYSQQLGTGSASNGTFSVAGDLLTFKTGPVSGTITISKSFDSTCRILYGFGSALWRYGEVAGCPTGARVSAADCANVGTFTRVDRSGSISASGSGSESEYTYTVTLGRDRFYTYDMDSFRTTCFAYNCKSLSSSIQTVVGSWSQSGGAPPYSLATLRAYPWTFKKSTAACP
jgi:hypothetical protein